MLKQRVIKGLIYGVIGVILNFSIISYCVHKNWIEIEKGLCVPELSKAISNPIVSTVVQASVCLVIGFIIGFLSASAPDKA